MSTEPYVPTLLVVRHAVTFPRERLGEPRPISPEAFDRFIAKVKADALREAAQSARGMHDPVAPDCAEWADWLDARADRIEGKHE